MDYSIEQLRMVNISQISVTCPGQASPGFFLWLFLRVAPTFINRKLWPLVEKNLMLLLRTSETY